LETLDILSRNVELTTGDFGEEYQEVTGTLAFTVLGNLKGGFSTVYFT